MFFDTKAAILSFLEEIFQFSAQILKEFEGGGAMDMERGRQREILLIHTRER